MLLNKKDLQREILDLNINIQTASELFLLICSKKPSVLIAVNEKDILNIQKITKRYRIKIRKTGKGRIVASKNKKILARLYSADTDPRGHFYKKNALVLGLDLGYPKESVEHFLDRKPNTYLNWDQLCILDPNLDYIFGIGYKVFSGSPKDISIGKKRILYLKKFAPKIYSIYRHKYLSAIEQSGKT